VSGPYPTTLSGNKYIIGFIDLYSGWPEAFSVPAKTTDNVAHLLIEEIIPRHSGIQILTSDNGGENCSKVMQEVCEELNIKHIKTSFYHPQGNAKIERFHRTLHDILSKLTADNPKSWDLFLNQALAAIRFNPSDTTKMSPFFALYNRDPVLPLDNILQPRRKYHGEQYHKIALERQHKSFLLVHKFQKRAKRRQVRYANKGVKDVEFQVGDPVYFKNQVRENKLSSRWLPYYRIIEQASPVNFMIKNQLTGKTTKAHAEQIRLASLEWEIPKQALKQNQRNATMAVPVETDSDIKSSSESDDDTPLAKLAKMYRREIETSDEEDNIPLMELGKRLRARQIFDQNQTHASMSSLQSSDSKDSINSRQFNDENSAPNSDLKLGKDSPMSVDLVSESVVEIAGF
jgi:transposase InsO family protein